MTSKSWEKKYLGLIMSYDKNSVYIFLLFLMFGMFFWIVDSLISDYYLSGSFLVLNSEGQTAAFNPLIASGYAFFVRVLFFLACVASGILVAGHMERESRMRSALEESERKFRTISERISDLIFVLDENLEIIYINPAVKAVLGYSQEEILEKKPYEDAYSINFELLKNETGNFLNEKSGYKVTLKLRRSDNNFSLIEFTGFCDLGGKRKICYLIGKDITDDVDSREREKAALEQINHNLGQLAVLNDHIRNPLTVIVAYADILEGTESKAIIEQAYEIDSIIKKLDIGWLESAKIRDFLVKHYNITKEV